jgi:hypothetical protein
LIIEAKKRNVSSFFTQSPFFVQLASLWLFSDPDRQVEPDFRPFARAFSDPKGPDSGLLGSYLSGPQAE